MIFADATRNGRRWHEYKTDWCGGKDGLETIKRFLTDSKAHLLPNGKVFLGFNSNYLKEHTVNRLCKSIGYMITDIYSFPLYPSKVFILEL